MVNFDFGNNEKLYLCINNYQYPDAGRDCFKYDRNWLDIHISVQTHAGSWQINDPSLLTWELKMLIDEFRKIETETITGAKTICFTEPNLMFKLFPSSDKGINMRIYIDEESKPDKFQNDGDFFIEGWISMKDLSKISDSLQEELNKFPERESDW